MNKFVTQDNYFHIFVSTCSTKSPKHKYILTFLNVLIIHYIMEKNGPKRLRVSFLSFLRKLFIWQAVKRLVIRIRLIQTVWLRKWVQDICHTIIYGDITNRYWWMPFIKRWRLHTVGRRGENYEFGVMLFIFYARFVLLQVLLRDQLQLNPPSVRI